MTGPSNEGTSGWNAGDGDPFRKDQPPTEQPGGYPAPPTSGGNYPTPPQGGGYPQPTTGLPPGVELASIGRRIGAYFLGGLLSIVTLGIGWFIWGAIVWGKGTSPALQVLGMRCWNERENKPAGWGTMALRNIVGGIVQGILSIITALISFIMFLTGEKRQSLPDKIGGTIVVYDPNKVLG